MSENNPLNSYDFFKETRQFSYHLDALAGGSGLIGTWETLMVEDLLI
jgi:hypothetical protein